jgi:hypothetical protein
MEPLLIILLPGLFGGLVLAVIIAGIRWKTPSTVVPRRLESPSPSLINMAHIRVEGVGGLGMVAAVVAVALSDPRIRLAIVIALVLGVGLALCLILRRREQPFDGDGPEDFSTLRIDGERRRPSVRRARPSLDSLERAAALRFRDTERMVLSR